MADNADIAAELMEHHLEGALAKARCQKFAQQHLLGSIQPECDDCGFEIPAARREAAPWATTCIGCQGIREERAAQRR